LTETRGVPIYKERKNSNRPGPSLEKENDMAEQVSDSTFEASVLKSDLPVMVDFWAPWCGPCRAMGPIVDECTEEYAGKLKVFKMNVDENPATPARFGIRAIPTLIIFKDGNAVEQHTGSMPKDQLRQLIDSKAF